MPDLIHITAYPHPLRRDAAVQTTAPVGSSVADMVGEAHEYTEVLVGGVPVPRTHWSQVRPKAGVGVIVYTTAGKKKWVKKAYKFIKNPAGGIPLFGAIGAAAIRLGERVQDYLVGLLIPMPKIPGPGEETKQRAGITGTRNQSNPYGPIPSVLGEHKVYPPNAALPFTENIGDEQYLRVLLMLGYGPMDVTDIKIGETPIAQFPGVETEISETPSLFSVDASEEQLALALETAATTHTRNTAAGVDEIGIDVAFPYGLFGVTNDNKTTSAALSIAVEYRVAGSGGAWLTASSAAGFQTTAGWIVGSGANVIFTGMERISRTAGVRWKVARGQYEVRLTRGTVTYGAGTSTDTAARNDKASWAALRGITYTSPSSIPGTLKLALRIKASEVLGGSLDRINCIVKRKVLVPDAQGVESYQLTRNPAWLFRHILTATETERRVGPERIDLDELKLWAAECDANGRTFDTVIDQRITVSDLLDDICAAGRAARSVRDGRYSVVRDLAAQPVVQWFTPRNSSGLKVDTNLDEMAHAVKVRYVSIPKDWQQDEIIAYDDGYSVLNATRFDTIQLRGCTSSDTAWRAGRYYLAQRRLRPRIYTLRADWEALVCQRGQVVGISSDVIDIGTAWARIIAMPTTTQYVLDSEVTMTAGSSYALRVRLSDGTSGLRAVTFAAGDTSTVTIASAISGAAVGDLVLFGVMASESIRCKVQRIERGSDLDATLTLVDEAPDILTADQGVPPAPPVARLMVDPSQVKCCPPVIRAATSGGRQSAGATEGGGAARPRMSLALERRGVLQ